MSEFKPVTPDFAVAAQFDPGVQGQRRLQREQDGSEVKSVELERLTAEGQTLIERRSSLELFRDLSAEAFEHHTGSAWRPRSGSRVSHRHLTAAMIDSRDFLAAKRRAEAELLLPAGSRLAGRALLEAETALVMVQAEVGQRIAARRAVRRRQRHQRPVAPAFDQRHAGRFNHRDAVRNVRKSRRSEGRVSAGGGPGRRRPRRGSGARRGAGRRGRRGRGTW